MPTSYIGVIIILYSWKLSKPITFAFLQLCQIKICKYLDNIIHDGRMHLISEN